MRAIVTDEQGPRLSSDRADPVPGPGVAVCAVRRAAVDAADLRAVRRGFVGVLGHQYVADVVAMPTDADAATRERWQNARVIGSADVACGRCDMCKGGLHAHCRERTTLGLLGRDGVFAERFAVPVRNLVRVPDEVDDDAAVLAMALAQVIHLPQLVHVEHKPFVTVLGDSAPALLAAQLLSPLNDRVRVIGTDPARFDVCERWGVRHRHVDDIGRRADQDVVVVLGSAEPLSLGTAAALVRPRGEIVLCEPPDPDEHADLAPLVRNELKVMGARRGSPGEALHAVASGAVETSGLITHRAKLSDGSSALRTALEPGQLRVTIDP